MKDNEASGVEYYVITKDGKRFAGFTEGDPSRFDEPMSYAVFKKEFEACVEFWERKGIARDRFGYLIVFDFKKRGA